MIALKVRIGGTPMPTLGTSVLPGICASGARRSAGVVVLALIAVACSTFANPVKIEFLPPPMEGTLSLGVYDTAGKLVRVLHREAEWSELTPGDDGLVTQWDGKDEQGKSCQPGAYRVRGVAVGDLGVEGVDFIGNDWVTEDDSPHLRRITALGMSWNGTPFITETCKNSAPSYYSILLKPATAPGEDPEAQLTRENEMPPIRMEKRRPPVLPSGLKASAFGENGTSWAIDGNAVKQYSAKGEMLRSVSAQAGDPPPSKLTASPTEEKIYVLYENAALQRLRGYDFTGVKPGAELKVLFENDIRASDTCEQIASELKFPDEKPFVPSSVLTVALVPNPLDNNKSGSLQIRAGVDKTGCYLATADGLPLCHINETKYLRWAAMGQPAGSKAITLFDSDSAVVEQFQISKIANMMTFDAGVIQWPGEATAPTPSPTAASAVSPAAFPSPAPSASIPAAVSGSQGAKPPLP